MNQPLRHLPVTTIVGVLLLFTPGVGAARPLTFDVTIGDCAPSGHAPAGSTWFISWSIEGELRVKGLQQVKATPAGTWAMRCQAGVRIEGDDVFVAQTATRTRQVTVPRLGLWTNREADGIKVQGPASTYLMLGFSPLDGLAPGGETARDVFQTGTDGTYTSNAWALTGGDRVSLTWMGAEGDTVRRVVTVPYLGVWLQSGDIFGAARPGEHVLVSLYRPVVPDVTMLHLSADSSGDFKGTFLDVDGDPVRIHAGNQLNASDNGEFGGVAKDAAFTVSVEPNQFGPASAAMNSLNGVCLPGGAYAVLVRPAGGGAKTVRYGIAGPGGEFFVRTASVMKHGDPLEFRCKLPTGDVVGYRTANY